MNIQFNVQNMQMQMGAMPVDLQMMDYEPHYPPRGPTSPDPPLDQTPVPILFERVSQGLREGDYHLVYEALAQLNVFGRTDLGFLANMIAPYETVIERLWDQFRKSEGKQGPMPSVDCLERSGLTDLLFGDLYRLSDPLQRTLVSPLYDHVVSLEDVVAQVDALAAQFRPSRDFINALPEELLIRIGHIVLGPISVDLDDEIDPLRTRSRWSHELLAEDKHRRQDNDRLSLSAVSRRWRAIFGLGEFWDEVTLTADALLVAELSAGIRNGRGSKMLKKLDAFISKGGVQALRMRALCKSEELLPALDVMEGRSASVRSWWVTLPNGVTFERALDVWKANNDCRLNDLWIVASDVSLPARPIDLSSLTHLRLGCSVVDLVSLLPRLPNLTVLQLDHCSVDRAKASADHPVIIRLANLSTLVSYGHPGTFYQAGSVLFETPNLSELRIQGDPDEVAAFLPLSPRPSLKHLKLLALPDTLEGDYGLVPILDRHPSIVELRLCSGGTISAAVDALGRGTCPNLRVFHIQPSIMDQTLGPAVGQSVLAMIRAREAAANRGDELAALWEFHFDGGWFDSKMFSEEEKEWLWVHLRVLGGFGSRPKRIPAPA